MKQKAGESNLADLTWTYRLPRTENEGWEHHPHLNWRQASLIPGSRAGDAFDLGHSELWRLQADPLPSLFPDST